MSEGILPQKSQGKSNPGKSAFELGYGMVTPKEKQTKIEKNEKLDSLKQVSAAASGSSTFLGGVGQVFSNFKDGVTKIEKPWMLFRDESRLEEVFPNDQIPPQVLVAYKKLNAPQKAAFNELSKEEKINYFNTLTKNTPEKKSAPPRPQRNSVPEASVKKNIEKPDKLAKLFRGQVPKIVQKTYDGLPPKKREEYLATVEKNVEYYKTLLIKEKVSRQQKQNQKEKTEKTSVVKEKELVSAEGIKALQDRLNNLSAKIAAGTVGPGVEKKIQNIERNIKRLEAAQVSVPDRTPAEYRMELNAHVLAYTEHLKRQEELKKREEKSNPSPASNKVKNVSVAPTNSNEGQVKDSKKPIEELPKPENDIIVEENKNQEDILKAEERNRFAGLGKLSNESMFLARKDAAKGRRDELDSHSVSLGLEGHFRKLGEKYAKVGWKQKLGVGVALGLGAAALSPVSFPAAMACMSGLFAQRVAGMAHAYIGAEKFLKFNAEKREGSAIAEFIDKKEIAILGAALYSIGMGAGISYAVKEASQYIGDITGFNLNELNTFVGHIKEGTAEYTKAMGDWVKNYWPFNHPGVPSQTAHEFKITPLPIEKTPDAGLFDAHEKVISPAASITIENNPAEVGGVSEMPSVAAVKGQGYEYMLKQLWEHLHKQGVKIPEGADANNSYPDSDLAKLLAADKDSIGTVAHQIASQAGHGFNADGSSIKIGLDTVMTIDADGQVHIAEAQQSAAEALKSVPKSAGQLIREFDALGKQAADSSSGTKSAQEILKGNQQFENLGKHTPSSEGVQSAPEAKSIEKTAYIAPEMHQQQSGAHPVVEKPISPLHPTTMQVNTHGLPVSIDSVGSYTDADGRHVVFGGTAAERIEAAKALVEKNHDTEVYFNSGDKDGHLKKVFFDPGSSWSLNPVHSEIKIVETTDNPIRPNDLTEAYTPRDNSVDNYNSSPKNMSGAAVEHSNAPSNKDIPMVVHTEKFINSNNISIDPLHGHIFEGKGGAIYAYGNSFSERLDAAQEYAKSHPGASVWVQADKPVLFEGALRPYVLEVKYEGFWKGGMQILGVDGPMDPSRIGGVDPKEFTKQLDISKSKK